MINAIIIGLFIVVIAIIAFVMRKSRLSAIVYEGGEVIIREFHGISMVESKGMGPRIVQFRNCAVIVTNKRVIIAQKIAFSKESQARYIIRKGTPESFWLKDGIVTFGAGAVTMREVKEKRTHVLITPRDPSAMIREIKIYSDAAGDILMSLLS